MPSIYINENDISGSDGLFISNIYSGKILGEIMRLQNKTVNIIENGETNVTFDTGYTGLSNVKIITNVVPETQTKSVTITQNGSTTVTPQSGYALSKVDVQVSVPNPSTGVINITENGFYDTMTKAGVIVNVPQGITPLDYTVQCSAENQIVEKLTVKSGMKIPSPLYTPTSGSFFGWKDSDNNTIDFTNGYTVSKNETIYAIVGSTYADELFDSFVIDKTVYPYIRVGIDGPNTYGYYTYYLFFAKSYYISDGWLRLGSSHYDDVIYCYLSNIAPMPTTYDVDSVVNYMCSNASNFNSYSMQVDNSTTDANTKLYTNFDTTGLLGIKYDLNTYKPT